MAVFILQLGADHLPALQAHMIDREIPQIGDMNHLADGKL